MNKKLVLIVLTIGILSGCEEAEKAMDITSDKIEKTAASINESVSSNLEEKNITEIMDGIKEDWESIKDLDANMPDDAERLESAFEGFYVCIKEATTDNFAESTLKSLIDTVEEPSMSKLLDRAIDKGKEAVGCEF